MLSACSSNGGSQTLSIVSVFPTTGTDGVLGLALQQAVDLAVKQNATLSGGYQLQVEHVDEALGSPDQVVAGDISAGGVVGVVGPFSGDTALALAPVVARAGIVTISPTATLAGLTLADSAKAEGLDFNAIHPQGDPVVFLRLPRNSDAEGKAAADLAVKAGGSGLSAHNISVVDDGSVSGKALAASFIAELKAKGGATLSHTSLAGGALSNPGAVVATIVQDGPDAVFYAGNTLAGAQLRGALSSSGVPALPLLTADPSADNPSWADAVGNPLFSGATMGLLPARDFSALSGAQAFTAAYQSSYRGATLPPQAAMAYDAAMDEIAAIKAIIAAGKTPTAHAVLAGVMGATHHGVSGDIAFDKNGDDTNATPFSIYKCDDKGQWKYSGVAGG
jgi:branched-chain amino acid transport system substrate-binding protein